MDTNNWRPTAAQGAEPAVDTSDWRAQLAAESRQRIVSKILETLKRHLPFSGQEGLEELKKIAVRFEEKIYTAAISQPDYLRKISLKMLTMESKSQNTIPNSMPPNPSSNSNRPPDAGASHTMQHQVHNQGQSLRIPMSVNQSQMHQQMLLQNIQNNMASTGVQSSASLTSALPPVSGLSQASIPSVVGQNPSMQNSSGVPQISSGNSMGQGVLSNMFTNSQRQMPGRQQVVLQQQTTQQQQQPQHQQQNLLPSSQQSSMQTSSVMQPSMILPPTLPCFQQNQPSSVQQSGQPMLQQHPQAVLRQQQQTLLAASILQQQASMMQQPLLSSQQNPVSTPQQVNVTNLLSQNVLNPLPPNIPLQSDPNMLQHQRQQQDKMLQTQLLKQHLQQHQMQHQQQMLLQQQLLYTKQQQLPAQMHAHQISQVHRMSDVNELKIRPGMGVKQGIFQQHLSGGQRPTYSHQQMMSGASFQISSPQLLQAASPQLSQHSSPQVDQQNLLSSLTKTGTPLQSANSPLIVPSPSTPLAPSPLPGDSEKPFTGLSSLCNAGNIGQPPTPSLAIGTPGISPSPLLAEFPVSDGGHANALAISSGKRNVTEQFIGGQAAGYAAADAVQALPLVSTLKSSRITYVLLVSMLCTFIVAVGVLMASSGHRK